MARSRISGILTWLVVLALLGGGGWAFWRWRQQHTVAAGTPTIRTNAVARGDIVQSVTANGALNPVRIVSVGSQISGIITEVNVDFNSKVKEGDILAKIDPSTYEREVARAEADLASAKAGLAMADVNLERDKALFANKLISEVDFKQSEVNRLQADASMKMRDAAVARAKVDLERTTILAPIGGMIISRKVEAGQTVAASFNTPELFTIANDLSKMQIETMVSEADVGGVEEGQKVNFLVDAFPNRQFSGRVKQVRYAPTTNQNVVTYTTIVEVDNKDMKLRPGMTANATILTAQRTNVIRVPNAAFRVRPTDGIRVASTNDAVAKAAGNNRMGPPGGSGDLPPPPWASEGRRPTQEEREKYEASLTPEQKEQYRQMRERMRAAMAAASAGGEGGGGAGGGARPPRPATQDGPAIRTVYIVDAAQSTPEALVLQAVSVKTGISDGTLTEIAEGLKEGDVVVTSITVPVTAAAPAANPFGGPFGGPGRR
ncbi:MAG: efflux RND transporter periplasmic adaptor subunit [Verrucomicrobiales bacterium]|nr:efflux RND transporter periplasmic adaptor subunit [Verrucomicrobiales bacterium]